MPPAVACGGGSEEEPGPTAGSPLSPAAELPDGPPAGVAGPLLVYRSTLDSTTVATMPDRSRSWNLGYDPTSQYVLGVDCTPDGRSAAYLIEDNRSLDNRLVIVGASPREIPLSGEVVAAAWSPDGTQIAVTSYSPELVSGSLTLIDPASGEATEVLRQTGTIGAPRWSPDGTRIAFDGAARTSNQLFVYTLGDAEAVQLGTIVEGGFSPDWSPAGDTLIFSSYSADGLAQLFTLPAAGGEPAQLTTGTVSKALPRWSPDGKAIAYVGTVQVPTAARFPMSLHNVGVYVSAPDGSNEQLLTDLTQDAWLLGWCTAGPWLSSGWTAR